MCRSEIRSIFGASEHLQTPLLDCRNQSLPVRLIFHGARVSRVGLLAVTRVCRFATGRTPSQCRARPFRRVHRDHADAPLPPLAICTGLTNANTRPVSSRMVLVINCGDSPYGRTCSNGVKAQLRGTTPTRRFYTDADLAYFCCPM